MQVIIPLAGKGTRLRPHTHLTPKPMLKVAVRPVMDWVMDRLDGLDVSELIFVTGHLKEQVESYARVRYKIPSRFIEHVGDTVRPGIAERVTFVADLRRNERFWISARRFGREFVGKEQLRRGVG